MNTISSHTTTVLYEAIGGTHQALGDKGQRRSQADQQPDNSEADFEFGANEAIADSGIDNNRHILNVTA